MNFKTFCYRAALVASLFLTACGSPYLEQGFKTEADYDFAKSANLSPIGVDRFKSAGISNALQYKAAADEMRATGYSKSNEVDEVLNYAQDRFEGAKNGVSASQQKNARVSEAARMKAAKLEGDRLEAKRKADALEAKNAADKAEKAELERKRLESKRHVVERRDALRKSGVTQMEVLDLIVDAKSYEGKKVFLECIVHMMSASGGFCRSVDDKQSISISPDGIDKDDYRWLLANCSNQYIKDNASYCRAVPVVATFDSSWPRLKNVYIYELCKKRQVSLWTSIEDCDINAH